MKSLIKYSIPINEYVKYLKDNKYPAKALLSTDDTVACLGYILEFLSTKRIYLVVDNYNYTVYADVKYPQIDGYILCESNNTDVNNNVGTINNFKFAIDETFKILNTPF